jgi:hypothetical protein
MDVTRPGLGAVSAASGSRSAQNGLCIVVDEVSAMEPWGGTTSHSSHPATNCAANTEFDIDDHRSDDAGNQAIGALHSLTNASR